MITIIARLKAIQGKEQLLTDECVRMAKVVRENEKGCKMYIPYVSIEDPAVVVFIEQYEDANAFKHHGSTPYFKEFFGTIKPLLAEAPDIQQFEQ